MAFKFLAVATLFAYANAGALYAPAAPVVAHAVPAPVAYAAPAPVAYAAPAPVTYAAPAPLAYASPVAKTVVAARAEDYDPNPQYSYGYDVQDGLTGDSKSQSETRSGDVVQGTYSVVDPDGTKRTVDYTADPVHGFNAVVHREPLAVKAVAAPVIAKVAAPVAYATPVAKIAAPLAYAAPIAKAPLAYAAPVAGIAGPLSYSAHPSPVALAAPAIAKFGYAAPAYGAPAYTAITSVGWNIGAHVGEGLHKVQYASDKDQQQKCPIHESVRLTGFRVIWSRHIRIFAPHFSNIKDHRNRVVSLQFAIRLSKHQQKMAFRFIAFATLLAMAHAGALLQPAAYTSAPAPLTLANPVAKTIVAAPAEEYDPNPQYSYGYDVQDGLTGDSKSQTETRNGDVVEGSYSLVEPDGNRRIVDYTADPVNGFNAVVRREPAAIAVKTVAAAPAIAHAPIARLAPVTRVAAPVAIAPAPIARLAPAPVAYAAGPTLAAAPFAARVAAPLAAPLALAPHAPITYSAAPAVAKVAYSSPIVSYQL
ncbi:calphotin-like [Euwallacea similis]|uniref:calphotin-like n=1 Tax=Euwallacea similis TaxID=1736056 RepID=UPI00345014F6